MTLSSPDPYASPLSAGGDQSRAPQLTTIRTRYIVAIALFVVGWLLWSNAPRALELGLVGSGRSAYVFGDVLAMLFMAAGWAVLPGAVLRRLAGGAMVVVYMAVLTAWFWYPLFMPLWGSQGISILAWYANAMPVVFLAAWLIARRATGVSYLALLPVAGYAAYLAGQAFDLREVFAWRHVAVQGEWVIYVATTGTGLLSTALLVGMAWAARTESLERMAQPEPVQGPQTADAGASTLPPPPPGKA